MKHRITAVCLAAAMVFTASPAYVMAAEDAGDYMDRVEAADVQEEEAVPEETVQQEDTAAETEGPDAGDAAAAGEQEQADTTEDAQEEAPEEAEAAVEEQTVEEEKAEPAEEEKEQAGNTEEKENTEKDAQAAERAEEPAEPVEVAEAAETVEDDAAVSESNESMAATSGWKTVNGNKYYYVNGKPVTGVYKIGSVRYVFGNNGVLGSGFVKVGKEPHVNTYYAGPKGELQTGWLTLNGKKYYLLDKNLDTGYKQEYEGRRLGGFRSISGVKYYFAESGMKSFKEADAGVMMTGLVSVNGKEYFMDKAGAVQKGVVNVNGKGYFFNLRGERELLSGWRIINGSVYYFEKGIAAKGWKTLDGKKYHFASDFTVDIGWKTIDGSRYHFTREGVMDNGLTRISGKVYHFTDGKMDKGWKTVNGKTYYLGSSGAAVKSWQTIDGKKYHFAADFVMDIGWKSIGGYRYHFARNGVMDNAWKTIGGKTYHFTNGKMDKGWKTIAKRLYYFHPDGHQQKNGRVSIDGGMCAFDGNNVCVSKNSNISNVVTFAKKWIGKVPYKSSMNGTDPNNERKQELKAGRGSDDPWFVFHCLQKYGYQKEFINSYDWGSKPSLYKNARNIGKDISKAKMGDIICYSFGTPRNAANSHVSIYAGGGKEIQCAAGKGVVESSVNKKNIIGIIRFSN